MSAAEIIEQIKALPEGDFRVVADFVDEVRRSSRDAQTKIRPGVREAALEVFEQYDGLFRELAK